MNDNDIPPRWRIRRTRPGRWEVHLRLTATIPGIGYVHIPLGSWDHWADALAYVTRVQAQNYGTGVAA